MPRERNDAEPIRRVRELHDRLHRCADGLEEIDFLSSVLVRAGAGKVREAMDRLRAGDTKSLYGLLEKTRSRSPMSELADAAPFDDSSSFASRQKKRRLKKRRMDKKGIR